MAFQWYALVDGLPLSQGDILRNCLAPLPPRRVPQAAPEAAPGGAPGAAPALVAGAVAAVAPAAAVAPDVAVAVAPGAAVAVVPGAALAAPEPEESEEYDRVIILSQSCDLLDGQIRRVMVCPVYTLPEFLKVVGGGKDKQNSTKANLRAGRLTAYHLLNMCEIAGWEFPHLVADFGDAFSIPLEYAAELAGHHQRVQLLPPYREHLAQMFARFYMRVGLPIAVAPLP
jgi:hypothetical protein